MDPSMQTALITGASSGIGYELARCFAQDGYRIVAVARDEKKLERAAAEIAERYAVPVIPLAIDLAQPDAASRVAAELASRDLAVGALVNNAGAGLWGSFLENSPEAIDAQLGLLRSAVILTRLFVPGMAAKGKGLVLFVGSVYSFTPVPFQCLYAASKSHMLSFARTLSLELDRDGVKVSILCPGITETAFRSRGGIAEKKSAWLSMSAEDVARKGYRGLKQGKTVIIPGWINKCYVAAGKFLPGRLFGGAIKRLIDKLRGLKID